MYFVSVVIVKIDMYKVVESYLSTPTSQFCILVVIMKWIIKCLFQKLHHWEDQKQHGVTADGHGSVRNWAHSKVFLGG